MKTKFLSAIMFFIISNFNNVQDENIGKSLYFLGEVVGVQVDEAFSTTRLEVIGGNMGGPVVVLVTEDTKLEWGKKRQEFKIGEQLKIFHTQKITQSKPNLCVATKIQQIGNSKK